MAKPLPSSSTSSATSTTTISSSSRSLLKDTITPNRELSKSRRLRLRPSSVNQQQQQSKQQQQKSLYSVTSHPSQQRSGHLQQLSNSNGREGDHSRKDVLSGKHALKKRRISIPFKTQEEANHIGGDDDEEHGRGRFNGSGEASGAQAKPRRSVVLSEIANPQDDDENDTDDFQTPPGPTRSMMKTRRHDCVQDHNNNSSSSSIAGTPTRDLSRYPPYPEHLGSSLPNPPPLSRSAAHTRGIIDKSSQLNLVSPTPLRKRSSSKVPTSFSDTIKTPNQRATLRKPKVEEQDDEHWQLRLSLTLPEEGSVHEAEVYKALEDHGTSYWRAWCTDMHYEDKDRVTSIKLKDYIDFAVMPKEREMMKACWRLPGHPGFMAVSGLELYVRPVVHLWCEQSLQAELEALRDTKLRANRVQQPQPQQTSEQQRFSSHLRQTKPIPKTRQQPLPQKQAFVPATRRPVKAIVTAATLTTPTNQQAHIRRDDRGKVENANKDREVETPKEIDEQENGIETRGEDKNIEDEDKQDRDVGSGNHIAPEKDQAHQTETVDEQDADKSAATGEGVSGATLLSALVAPPTPTLSLPDSPVLPSHRRSPPTPPSSQPPGLTNQFRANDIQLLVMKDHSLPRLGLGPRNKVIRHHLSSKIETIAGVLTEWVVGIEGGPSIQQLNSVYGLNWQYSYEEKEYSGREAIVREFKRLVVEDGRTDETALRLLEEEVSSSSMKDLVARLKSTRKAKLVE